MPGLLTVKKEQAQLQEHILKFAHPSQEELASFFESLELQEIDNKDFIVKRGQLCRHQYFIVKGCFRVFFINKKGVEKITNFGIENWWITDHDSFGNQIPSQLYIQAVENSLVFRINKSALDEVLAHSLELNRYFRIIWERVRIADQKRIQFMFDLSGRELYQSFLDYNPDFVQRVPQYMLASYLGFTPEFLSKIRGEK